MSILRTICVVGLVTACTRAKPRVYAPGEQIPGYETAPPASTTEAERPASSTDVPTEKPPTSAPPAPHAGPAPDSVRVFATPTQPMSLVLFHDTLVWADAGASIWAMPADGSAPPKQLSEQHRDGLATRPFIAGDKLYAKAGKGLLRITVPDGPVTKLTWTGVPTLPETVASDGTTAVMTLFQNTQILRAPMEGGAAQPVTSAKRALVAVAGGTLYIASFTTGTLTAMPIAGGTPKTIASKLPQPTALEVEGAFAYLYTEGNKRVVRVELASGKTDVLGEQLENSDEVDVAEDAVYTVSWPNKLVRLPKAPGGASTALASDLHQPRGIAHDQKWVYVTSDSPARIVRVLRATP